MSWITIEHEGVRRRVAVVRTPAGTWVGWPGGATLLKPKDHSAQARVVDGTLVAPMTGKVVQVRVQPGQRVRTDDVLVVLEAMKMEYRLTAPHDGAVAVVACKQGQLVDLGVTLVTLTKSDD